MPIVPVSAANATQESVPTELRVVGTVEASAIVQIKSQVSGQLLTVGFTEGQNVATGDLLFEIDPRPYEEALRQAEANVARDRAQISQLEATLARDSAQAKYNLSDAERYAELARAGVVSRAQSDQVRTGADVARESARATQAGIESANAPLDSDLSPLAAAQLNPNYRQFLTSVLTQDTLRGATVVPAEAVQAGQQGQFIYVVGTDSKVAIRPVSAGRAFGKKMVIEKGIAPGDTVVIDGQLRLFPGAQVQLVDPSKLDVGKS